MKKNPKTRVENDSLLMREDGMIMLGNKLTKVVGSSNPRWFNFYGYKICSGDGAAGKIIGDG